MPRSPIRITAASALTLALAALSPLLPAGRAGAQDDHPLTGVQQARIDSLRRPYTQADIDFMSGMIGHHAQAVKMAGWCKSHGANPSLQIFCARIVTGQSAEIDLMSQWLRERNQPVPPPDPRGMAMMMNGQMTFMMMPGMLTPAQMAQLDSARGTRFDRLFLTGMIGHHQGAIDMVTKLFATPGAAQDETVFKFANDVQVDQSTEIARMQQMLAAPPPADAGGRR